MSWQELFICKFIRLVSVRALAEIKTLYHFPFKLFQDAMSAQYPQAEIAAHGKVYDLPVL